MLSYRVENMSCSHCVRAVTDAVRSIDAGARVDVDLARREVRVEGGRLAEGIARAIAEAGYPATLLHAAA